MKRAPETHLDQYLAHLRELPFIEDVRLERLEPAGTRGPTLRPDAIAVLRTARGKHRFRVEIKRTFLTEPLVRALVARLHATPGDPWLLFTLYLPPRLAHILNEAQICYVDEPGNCRMAIGKDHLATIEGRKLTRKDPRGRGMGVPGHQILFATLADEDLLNVPIRQFAKVAAVGNTAVTHALEKLWAEGFIAKGATRRHLVNYELLLERWLAGYANLVRPRMMVGTFHVQTQNPTDTEHLIENALKDTLTWAWGGGAAAMRLTKHYRGKETVLHVQDPPHDLPQRIRAIPAKEGHITILKTAGKLAYQGAAPRTVHPLLVYAELLAANNERAREAGEEIRLKYLRQQP